MGAFMLAILSPAAALAARAPVPPCAGDPQPAYPALGAAPAVAVWQADAFGNLRVPQCATFGRADAAVIVALAGRFAAPNLEAILTRLGAISALAKIRYWSITDRSYEALFDQAAAVTGPDGRTRRADFTAAEIESGKDLYFSETDNRTGSDVVYRLRFQKTAPGRFLITIGNVSPARWLGIPVLGPGDLRMVYYLAHAGHEWNFYALSLVSTDFPLLSLFIRGQSYVNRAVALYRFLADR
jgi:Family of unknown function (DUF6675)